MAPIDLSLYSFVALFFTGLCAGFVDSVAGGGGLISLPALLSVGIPAPIALGTNKLQGTCGAFSSAYNFIRKGVVRFSDIYFGIFFTAVGAFIGAWSIQRLQTDFLQRLIPVLLSLVFLYTLFSKGLGRDDSVARIPAVVFFLIFGLGLGFYDGFFGPGTGSFWTAALLLLMGVNMTKASGLTRVVNFTSNIVALLVFVSGGNVLYSVGICMAVGQIIGARIGSSLAIKRGAAFIRPVFLTVVFLTILKLVYSTYF